jgi:hypothetical protein
VRQVAAQDQEAGYQEEECQPTHQEEQDQEVQEEHSRVVLVPWVDRAGEEDRTGRSFWRVSDSFLSRS